MRTTFLSGLLALAAAQAAAHPGSHAHMHSDAATFGVWELLAVLLLLASVAAAHHRALKRQAMVRADISDKK